jgi:3-deoxy-manno-octulosonate cytidylyltransferase (CMP-KDO synthetase)
VASTTSEPLESIEGFLDPNVVKVVTRLDGRALYFSRRLFPSRDAASSRAFTCPELVLKAHWTLRLSARLPPCIREDGADAPERLERLEQLRIIESGYDLLVVESWIDRSPWTLGRSRAGYARSGTSGFQIERSRP